MAIARAANTTRHRIAEKLWCHHEQVLAVALVNPGLRERMAMSPVVMAALEALETIAIPEAMEAMAIPEAIAQRVVARALAPWNRHHVWH